MPSERSIQLAKAVQILRGSGSEPEHLVADLTDALANALTERDDLRSRCDELEAANGTLQERRDEAMTDRIETERLLHSVTSQALALVTERDALAQRIEKAKAWLSELGHTDDGEMLANQKETQ